ncbi:MAG: penicillin-binding protein activator [Woeseiaceae bacterium]|nr:penicillin-binding protein activator [Woeseiaceae bacterium]
MRRGSCRRRHRSPNCPACITATGQANAVCGRLHALGYDAFHLVAALYSADLDGMREIDGATGRLYLDSDGRIHRRLAWARFENGEPVPVPPAAGSGDSIDDIGADQGYRRGAARHPVAVPKRLPVAGY